MASAISIAWLPTNQYRYVASLLKLTTWFAAILVEFKVAMVLAKCNTNKYKGTVYPV